MPQTIIYRDEFAQAVKEAMGDLNMSQVAYKTRISYEWVRKIVQHGHVPSEEVIERLAKGLNTDLHTLRVAAGYEESNDPLDRCINGLRASRLSEKTLSDIRGYIAQKIAEEESRK